MSYKKQELPLIILYLRGGVVKTEGETGVRPPYNTNN